MFKVLGGFSRHRECLSGLNGQSWPANCTGGHTMQHWSVMLIGLPSYVQCQTNTALQNTETYLIPCYYSCSNNR